jgi:hypothetical protein
VRAAMLKHGKICNDLKNLNAYIVKVKKSIQINKIFTRIHCRLRLDKKVRWGSGFTVLILVRKAFERNAIASVYREHQLKCPLSLKIVNDYIEVLKPAYKFNIRMQSNTATISDVIPYLLKMFCYWNKQIKSDTVTASCKKLCRLLIKDFKDRFDYELNSILYQVINFY